MEANQKILMVIGLSLSRPSRVRLNSLKFKMATKLGRYKYLNQ